MSAPLLEVVDLAKDYVLPRDRLGRNERPRLAHQLDMELSQTGKKGVKAAHVHDPTHAWLNGRLRGLVARILSSLPLGPRP